MLVLRLPPPSAELKSQIQTCIDGIDLDPDRKLWLDEFHNGINSTLHIFDRAEFLDDKLCIEYQKFFPNRKICLVIGIMKNSGSAPACQPPHIDRGRALAVNYYLELGGQSVDTVFYDKTSVAGEVAQNLRYQDVQEINRHRLKSDTWYAYDVWRCHSVENIEATRSFFSIAFLDKHGYNMEDLYKDYPELVKDKL
jgi:hypothetical protein